MNTLMSESQVDDFIDNVLGVKNPNIWKNNNKLICCPVHGESNPSMGISSEKSVCHCFSCGFAGDFAKLLIYSQPDNFGFDNSTPDSENKTFGRAYRRAREFLAERYELELHEVSGISHNINRYEQLKTPIKEVKKLPMYKLAPFMSGKETYNYFFQRGFDKEDMKTFMIGRDVDNKTVTIPVFYEDHSLAGIIGRYIDKNRKKNQRYKIYEGFERSSLLYPLDKVEIVDDCIILVEGQFDAIRMYKLGYRNTLALMTSQLSKAQADWICNHCSKVIWVCDNDDRSREGMEFSKNLLLNRVTFQTVRYPSYGKDVCDWSDEDIRAMIDKAGHNSIKIIRLE